MLFRSEGVQEQNCRSHCSFRPLHLLSPFPSTQDHSFQPRTHSNPSWPTSHLYFLAQIEAQCSNPFSFPFLFFSFLFFLPLAHHFPLSSPMLPASSYNHPISCNQPPLLSLSPFFSHANSHHPTCPSLSPFSSPCFLHEQPPKHPPHLQISCQNTLLAAP